MANVNPPQPVPQLGPQPDFARLTQGFQQAAAELGNFANLPVFAQGNALIQQMQQLQQVVQQQTDQQQQFQRQMQQQTDQQQQFQRQMQQQMQQFQHSQQRMQQQIADVDNNIQAFRNEMRTSRQAT
jgi:dephospho-CoA kinase